MLEPSPPPFFLLLFILERLTYNGVPHDINNDNVSFGDVHLVCVLIEYIILLVYIYICFPAEKCQS